MPNKNTKNKPKGHEEVSQWIFIAPESALCCHGEDGTDPVFIKIPHPKTGKALQFLLSYNGQRIFEVLRFKEEPRSWLVEDSVQKACCVWYLGVSGAISGHFSTACNGKTDGSLYIISPVDSLFLILPYLLKYSQKFRTLEQILLDDDNPAICRLNGCVTSEELLSICDVKGDDDLQVYRLKEEKVIDWLKTKVKQTADSLSPSGVHVCKGSQSATFVRSKRRSDTSRGDYVRYAFGLVSDYLTSQWSEKLKESLCLADKEQLSSPKGPPTKRTKITDEIPEALEDYSKEFSKLKHKMDSEKPNTKLTAAQRSLSKVDKKGMKSLVSFFGGGGNKAKKR